MSFTKKSIKFLIIAIFVSLPVIVLTFKNRSKIKTEIDTTKNNLEIIEKSIVPQPTSTEIAGLPTYHLIKTAFVPQAPEKNWDQPWQDACEEASLLIVDYFYKNKKSEIPLMREDILNLVNFENTKEWDKSINTSQMSIIATDYLGYKPTIITNPTVDDIKSYISKNIPIIVPAAGKSLYEENKYFKDGGPYYHNIVILGFDDSKKQFIVHDVGTQHGAYFHYSYNLLIKSIHDFPDSKIDSEINNGPKKVLILTK